MDRNIDLLDLQVFPASDAIDFALPSERCCAPSHEDPANDATNENLDGCEQDTCRLTPSDESPKVKHWKPAEPQFCKEIAVHYGQSKRNIQKWFVDLREIAPWFSEVELRLSDDRYTPLAVELLGYRYFAGSKKKWESVLRERFADRVATAPFPDANPDAKTPLPLPLQVMGVEMLAQQQQAQSRALSLREQATQALNDANQTRLARLKEFFINQYGQRQVDQTQRRSQLEAEAQNEAIEEFLIKQQAKNAVLSQLEQLNSLGKLTAAPESPPSG